MVAPPGCEGSSSSGCSDPHFKGGRKNLTYTYPNNVKKVIAHRKRKDVIVASYLNQVLRHRVE